MSDNTDALHFEEVDDPEKADALFQTFVDGCGRAEFFAAIVDDGSTLHVAAAYDRRQALYLAHRLRRMAKEIEDDFDYGGGPEAPVTP